ncbi:MAG: hypothetical protein HY329_18570 [Chloroflexi bacterium]|nr:hypothetical protein [Chloroflexota bacterium]
MLTSRARSLEAGASVLDGRLPECVAAERDSFLDFLHELTLRATAWWLRRHDDYFLVGPLTRYAQHTGLSQPELAADLGMSRVALYHLMLCLTPKTPCDLQRLAAARELDPSRLAAVLGSAGSFALPSTPTTHALGAKIVLPASPEATQPKHARRVR